MRKMMSFMALASMLMIFAGCSYSVDTTVVLRATSSPITLTWGNVSWATGYNVYRGTVSGSVATKTLIAQTSPVSLTYIDTTANPTQAYYYQVAAVNAYGSISASNEVTAHDGILLGGSIQGKIPSLTKTVGTFAGFANISGATDGGSALFRDPKGIATDGTNLYVADTSNHTIRKIGIASKKVTTIAGQAGVSGFADGVGTQATFNSPSGITTDGTNLYVADFDNGTIRKIVLSTGVVSTIAGSPGNFGNQDGIGSAAKLNGPFGITTDGTNLYVTDFVEETIRRIVISTGAVTTIAGTNGAAGSADGLAVAASFRSPAGITTDGTNLYVADFDNGTIRKIVISTVAVTTIAGSAGVFGNVDAVGILARLNGPNGITTDGLNLYITDSNAETTRRIVLSTGVVTTLAGINGLFGSDDGPGSAALFSGPSGITVDGFSLYVADTSNQTIREIQ